MRGDDELMIARIASEHSVWALGRSLGEPVLNDNGLDDGLVDVLFPDADRPAAMEVTRVVDGDHGATHSAAGPVVDGRLGPAAQELDRGEWEFWLRAGTHVKDISPKLIELMRQLDPSRAGRFGDADLPQSLREAGLVSVYHHPDRPATAGIGTISSPDGQLPGVGPDLANAIANNEAKLRRADGYERHLAVWNQALRHGEPGRSPVPNLPGSIDYLWVIRLSNHPRGAVIWVASRRWHGWKTKGEPHE
ncbi:hypothetical protein BH24ACT7_BH24ACT7_23740 [soil metagenome]